MDQQTSKAIDLEEVRREIDEIDDGILALVQARFDVVARVRAAKLQQGDGDVSPLRPAREALILRRLIDENAGQIPDDLVMRLWRSIISRATLSQAPVQINVSTSLLENPDARKIITDHYVDFPLKAYAKEKMALNSLSKSAIELCIFPASSKWIDHLENETFDGIKVILSLPYQQNEETHFMIVLGRAPAERTGNDETLVKTSGKLPRDFVPGPLWELKTDDGHTLTSLPGFLTTSDSPLVGLMRGNAELALKVLGRYPSPFEV